MESKSIQNDFILIPSMSYIFASFRDYPLKLRLIYQNSVFEKKISKFADIVK